MASVLVRWTAVCCVSVFAPLAWACFPAPDAKPKHEISVLDLPPQPVSGVVLVAFESEGYLLRAAAGDLLPELSQNHMGVVSPQDLANALRSKMVLGQDIDAQELADVLIANARTSGGDATGANLSWIHMHAKDRLRYAFAKLLQESKVSVTEISSERVVPRIKLDRFSEICHGGRRFTSPEDKVILYVQDWIS
jgi:hypothetical protein